MDRDSATTTRLRNLISTIENLTASKALHWERQSGSAHRFARWNNNLLILGPAAPATNTNVPRYLFITPFDSPDCIEINSDDAELGPDIEKLVARVETVTRNQPPSDPFALNPEILKRLEH